MKSRLLIITVRLLIMSGLSLAYGEPSTKPAASVFGPFNALAEGSGPGHIEWFDGNPPTEPGSVWSLSAWIKPNEIPASRTLVAGFGDGLDFSGSERFFAIDTNGWFFFLGSDSGLLGRKPKIHLNKGHVLGGRLDTLAVVTPGKWQLLTATYDGQILRMFLNGEEKNTAVLSTGRAAMQVRIAPPPPWNDGALFKGAIAGLTIWDRVLAQEEVKALAKTPPGDLDKLAFTPPPAGPTPEQRTEPLIGRRSDILPQDPSSLPRPIPVVKTKRTPKLTNPQMPVTNAQGNLVLNRGWELAETSLVADAAKQISSPGFDTTAWYDATVPGTVLGTLVQQGVYPDPLYGLNNLTIPDDLSRKSWWYRVEFKTPADWKGRQINLTFNGINYHAEAWLNGQPLGKVTGAFIRGSFDATPFLKLGETNVLAVRIWPQPHNGATHEESLRTGKGYNGADAVLDGPTFFCAEGWDWIPTIRDRCTGIWQDVVLHPTGPVALGDSKVTTALPKLPDLSVAEVTIQSELRNLTEQPKKVTLQGSIAGAAFKIPVVLNARETVTVTADSKQFPQLAIKNPKLWWPNGYGEPALHDLTLKILEADGKESDASTQRIGLRTIAWTNNPQLTLSVNGRKVFCKGGNWGMDDALKRISRDRLEPYIRLHRDANLTMIRNWCGQSQSEAFFQLCDEYGLMVYNDFWLTSEGVDLPAIDIALFMTNAVDTVKRIRNHASIAVWSGRNEGTPPPWLAGRIVEMLDQLDGTRPYVPNSYDFPVSGLGPYGYVEPKTYFVASEKKAFTTELGVDSAPTAEAMRAMMPASELWPISDTWAHHDFHYQGGGYMKAIKASYGDAPDFDTFIRQAQMINYVSYRAMFEGWLARMWKPTSGVLLWMTHPAWPSMEWQIYSQDYDTHAAYYGSKKACEPIHVQWNLHDDTVSVINTLTAPLDKATVTVAFVALDGRELKKTTVTGDFAPDAASVAARLEWPAAATSTVVFLKLELRDRAGKLLSENFYWRAEKPETLQALNTMPPVKLQAKVYQSGSIWTVSLKNPSTVPALMAKLTLRDARTGERILPAYYQDNYISLLPGEAREVRIESGASASTGIISIDGWNVSSETLKQ